MKTVFRLFAVALAMTYVLPALAQPRQCSTYGLYLNSNDFTRKTLSYSIQPGDKKEQLRISDFFGSRNVIVIHEGKKRRFKTAELYGYRDPMGNDFRFFNQGVYRVMDTDAFYMYSHQEVLQTKGSLQPVTRYYFSVKGNDRLQSLTVENLDKAFPDNIEFHYALNAQFRADRDLAAYDNFSKKYKLKYLFDHSIYKL